MLFGYLLQLPLVPNGLSFELSKSFGDSPNPKYQLYHFDDIRRFLGAFSTGFQGLLDELCGEMHNLPEIVFPENFELIRPFQKREEKGKRNEALNKVLSNGFVAFLFFCSLFFLFLFLYL